MPRTFSAASALTWENHDCLVNTSGIWVLLTCPLKAEGAAQSTRGFGTQSCPSPVPWLSPAAPRVCAPPHSMLESVRQTASFQLFAVARVGVTAHYMQPITLESSLEGTGQGHRGGPRGF